MATKSPRGFMLYDPDTGKSRPISNLIEKLGVQAVARKYHVTARTVTRWMQGLHQPSRRTLSNSIKELF